MKTKVAYEGKTEGMDITQNRPTFVRLMV